MTARVNVYGKWVDAKVVSFLKGSTAVDSREPWLQVRSELKCHVFLSEESRRLLEVPSFQDRFSFPYSCDGYWVANSWLLVPVETLVVTSQITRLVVHLVGDPATPLNRLNWIKRI